MIVRTTWEEIAKLISEPQKKPHPEQCTVEILVIGEYDVQGSNGHWYKVNFGTTEGNNLFAACTCQGSLHGRACRHIRAAWPIHVTMAELEVDIEF